MQVGWYERTDERECKERTGQLTPGWEQRGRSECSEKSKTESIARLAPRAPETLFRPCASVDQFVLVAGILCGFSAIILPQVDTDAPA